MDYFEENGESRYGFSIYDRPSIPLNELMKATEKIKNSDVSQEYKQEQLEELYKGNAERAFMGKNKNGEISVHLNDQKGNQRIRMVIDAQGEPKLEFLNAHGDVTYKLPPE